MSIPQSLIIYRASRHQESHPMNLKHRYYSNKIIMSTRVTKTYQPRTFQQKYQRKMANIVRYLSLSLEIGGRKRFQVMLDFSKFHRVKNCLIQLNFETKALSKKSQGLAVKIIQRVFKTLKDLEQIEMRELDPLQNDPKIFKNLLRQRSLQKLFINPLKYTKDVHDLKPFKEFSQKASRRKCWPHLKLLRIDLSLSEERKKSTGSVKNLLEFLQDFKSCKSLYKQSHLRLILPENQSLRLCLSEADAFKKILKFRPPLTHISAYQAQHIKSLFGSAGLLKYLHSLSLDLSSKLIGYLNMDPLGKFPALQEISLKVHDPNLFDDEHPNAHFDYFALEKMRSMTNLRSVSIVFDGDPGGMDDLLCAAISKLPELTSLKLHFSEPEYSNYYEEEAGGPRELNWHWLKDVFEAIGKKKKLKELWLDFETFDFENASELFKSLSQAIGKLAELTSLHLKIGDAHLLKDQDVCTLASHIGKMTMMESLFLHIGYAQQFKSSTFVLLMDSIIKNLRRLSDFDLEFQKFDVTKQCYQVIFEAIHQMKCLNRMKIVIAGRVEKGVNVEHLDAEIHKKMAGSVYCQ